MTRSLIAHSTLSRVLRTGVLGALTLAVLPSTIGCLDRPVAPATPRTSNTLTDQIRLTAVDKIDLLFMIDNSSSMADKQEVLAAAVPDLVGRLVTPDCVKGTADGGIEKVSRDANGQCPAGSGPEFNAITDIHIGVVTSSLGGHGSPDRCLDLPQGGSGQTSGANFTGNDHAHLINRGAQVQGPYPSYAVVPTYDNRNFLAWDAEGKAEPKGESDVNKLTENFTAIVRGADQIGCGFEASLEAWYRFLVEPNPPLKVDAQNSSQIGPVATVSAEADTVLLRQRADFLRPDSLLAIVALSDENDCSIIDGQLPGDVCEDPILDDNGIAVDCNTGRIGWPRGYIENNAINLAYDETGNRVTGSTFGPNYLTSTTYGGLRLAIPTAACEDDPTSEECKSCYVVGNDDPSCYNTPGDSSSRIVLPSDKDDANVRCWEQKRRFGVDMLYPLQRYVDGLTQAKVYDRNGYHVANPLFSDLPYEQAQRDGEPLKRSRIQSRDPNLIFFAGIVGVPWQDIARDVNDLKQGFLPAIPSADDPTGGSIDWDLILGDPFRLDNNEERRGRQPTDPFMIETVDPRSGTNPLTGDEIVAPNAKGWNKINGHEYNTKSGDLQYSCIFDLPAKQAGSPTCDLDAMNPLCEQTAGSGEFGPDQYRAKAYPGTRFLQVLKDVSSHAIVASICADNLVNKESDDYGYRPAVATIIDRLKSQLTGRCLPRQLDPNTDGSTPCLIIDAKFPIDPTAPNDPDEVAECKKCQNDSNSRSPIPANVLEFLGADVKSKYECLCQVNQLTDEGTQDLTECRTDANIQSPTSGNGGWCYVDPASVDKNAPNAEELIEKAKTIVKDCPANEKRNIRFLNADTENTTLFITCLGASSGTSTEPTSSNMSTGATTSSLASTK